MRTATLIISLFAMCLIFLQSCTVGVGGEMMGDESTSEEGAMGILVAFLYLVGGAFAIGVPWISLVSFSFAALFGFAVAATGEFSDLGIWGGLAVILALLSYYGVREKKREQLK